MITPILFYACFHYNDFFRTFLVRDEVFSNNSCLWKVKKEDLDLLYRNLDLLP
ncbi:hypothetical protein HOLDEFILI_02633 [Holdemania filiformis DSM 12042]|uniref:Uncharacterized protein n=1 Tax=Holdemania filiformis DSM 12042 TaxID=545696 RepID=B9Y9X7_9FIRM|nr:hypothetical protein HOLDEFILI_02633 [Holdemania filiformis DSM 12042]